MLRIAVVANGNGIRMEGLLRSSGPVCCRAPRTSQTPARVPSRDDARAQLRTLAVVTPQRMTRGRHSLAENDPAAAECEAHPSRHRLDMRTCNQDASVCAASVYTVNIIFR